MQILIDECLPRKLKNHLTGHDAKTVSQMGWSGKKNGELLKLMVEKFDAFLTIDGNFRYQQNLAAANIIAIVLSAPNNRLETLTPLMNDVMQALKAVQAGEIIQIGDQA